MKFEIIKLDIPIVDYPWDVLETYKFEFENNDFEEYSKKLQAKVHRAIMGGNEGAHNSKLIYGYGRRI